MTVGFLKHFFNLLIPLQIIQMPRILAQFAKLRRWQGEKIWKMLLILWVMTRAQGIWFDWDGGWVGGWDVSGGYNEDGQGDGRRFKTRYETFSHFAFAIGGIRCLAGDQNNHDAYHLRLLQSELEFETGVSATWKSHGKCFLFSRPGLIMEFVR